MTLQFVPDTLQFVPDEDPKSTDAMDALTKTYQKWAEPGIGFLQQFGPMIAQGYGNIAGTIASGGDTQFASELGQEWAGKIPQLPLTEQGQETVQGLNEMGEAGVQALGQLPGYLQRRGQELHTMDQGVPPPPQTESDIKAEAGLTMGGELGAMAPVFGVPFMAARGITKGMGRFARPKFTPEQLEQARRAAGQRPVQPSVVSPEFQPSPMPLKPGEQGQLFPEPLRGPEGPQGELFPKQARSAEELRIDDTTRQPLQETIEPPRPPASPLLELEPRDTVDYSKLEESRIAQEQQAEQARNAERRMGYEVPPETPPVDNTIDFKLRQEVLDTPQMREQLDKYQRWVSEAEAEGNTLLAAELRRDFGDLMKQYGVDKPSDAYGRNLYEKGVEPKLPIETTSRPSLGAPAEWNPYAPGGFEGGTLRIGGKWGKQSGAIDFTFRRNEGKKIPIEDRLRIADNYVRQFQNDVNDIQRKLNDVTNQFSDYAKNLRDELPKAKEQLTYAKLHLDSLTTLLNQPKADISILGQTKRGEGQRGGPKQTEEYKNFVRNLPEPLRGHAAALWKEINKDTKPKAELVANQGQRDAITKVPGLKDPFKYIEPIINKTTEDIIELAKSEPNINLSMLGRGMTSGAMLTGVWKKSMLVHYVAQMANRAKVAANRSKYIHLLNKETGLKTLIDQLDGARNVWKALMEAEGLKDLDPADYKKYNLTPREIKAAEKFREVFNLIHEGLNETRKALGFKGELHRRPGYIPGIFGGDFQGMIWKRHIGERGKVTLEPLSRFGADTVWQANALRDYYAKQFQGLDIEVGEITHRALRPAELQDSNIIFNELAELLDKNDPMFQMVQELQERYLAGKAYEFAGVRKHFEPKKAKGILGAKGFEPHLNPEKNAQNGLQASLRYAEQAFDWMEIQKMVVEMKKIFSDPDLAKAQPNAIKYLDLYWKTLSKQGTMTSRAIDGISKAVAEVSGVGTSHIRDTTRAIKSALTIAALTTVKFAGVQLMQPIQMGAQMIAYLKGKGATGNPAYAFGMANIDMMRFLGKKEFKGTDLGSEAMRWAEDQHVLQSHILDDVRPETLQRVLGKTRDLTALPLKVLEEISRRFAYLNFVHFLENSGMERGAHMYETASNLTNMTMTDYRLFERPLFYQQLGVIGEAMSTLTPFKHNNYTQLFMAASKGQRTNMLPMLLGSTALFSGAIGLHFREDVDNLIHLINDYAPLEKPVPTLAGFFIQNLPDIGTFGGVSAITGGDLSTSFGSSKGLPNGGFDAIFPWTSDLVGKASTAANLIGNPSRDTALAAEHRWMPNQFKFRSEEQAMKGKMGVNPETHKATVERDQTDLTWRRLGGRSLRESREMIANREAQMHEQSLGAKRTAIIKMAQENPSRRSLLAAQYAKLSNNPAQAHQEFTNKMKEYEMQQTISQRDKTILKGGPVAKRRLEYERR